MGNTYTYYTIDDPSGDPAHGSTVGAINAAGEVAGTYWDFAGFGAPHGFVFDFNNNSWTTIEYPAGSNTHVLAIDDAGDVAGYYTGTDFIAHEFVDVNGVFTTLSYSNVINIAMNASGEVGSW